MKRIFALIMGLTLLTLLAGCAKDTKEPPPESPAPDMENATEGFGIEGYFYRVSDTCYIIPSDDSRTEELSDKYLKLENPPWLTPVNMEEFSSGDRIIAKGMTIADLSPRVLDVSEIELVERGTIDNIDPAIIEELDPSECVPDMIEKEIVSIRDTSEILDIGLPDMEEPFFEDRQYIYIFPNLMSEYIIVTYSDGSTENVKDALNSGHIALYDLDRFGIQYFCESKLIENIIDHAESGEIGTCDALEPFYSDDTYVYSFPSIRSQYVIVYYKDGTEEPIREALAAGKAKISDLDWFGIFYWKEEIE